MTPDAYAYHRMRLEPLCAGFRLTTLAGTAMIDIVLLAMARGDITIRPATPTQAANAAPRGFLPGKPGRISQNRNLA